VLLKTKKKGEYAFSVDVKTWKWLPPPLPLIQSQWSSLFFLFISPSYIYMYYTNCTHFVEIVWETLKKLTLFRRKCRSIFFLAVGYGKKLFQPAKSFLKLADFIE